MNKPIKIISCLGTGNYEETTYNHPQFPEINQQVKTCFIQEAVCDFYQAQSIYILLTKGARKKNWDALQEIFADKKDVELIPLDIPENNSPEEIWEIFNVITNAIAPDEEIVFDITHSFRSIPMVVLLSISYLRTINNVKIKGFVYGAYDPNKKGQDMPTFDLLPIMSLLDWITATDQFIKTGNGKQLVNLLGENQEENSTTLELATKIKNISQGLQLLRPRDVIQEASTLDDAIQKAKESVIQELPPFEKLLGKVKEDYANLGINLDSGDEKQDLINMLNMIEWYYQKDKIVQSICLAREWLVSFLGYQLNVSFSLEIDPSDQRQRDEVEILLAGGKIGDRTSVYRDKWKEWKKSNKELAKKVGDIWGNNLCLASLRNDVLHAGFRKNSRTASDIEERFLLIIDELKQLAQLI
ncbi:MAG: TIGR02221 family CRISPR-associated protein [Cyanobacterium sp.]